MLLLEKSELTAGRMELTLIVLGLNYSVIVLGEGVGYCFDILVGQKIFFFFLIESVFVMKKQYQTWNFVLLKQCYYCARMGTQKNDQAPPGMQLAWLPSTIPPPTRQ